MPVANVRRLTRASATGAALVLAVGLAAGGSSSAAQVSGPQVSTPVGAVAEPLTPKALVRHVALVNADFTDGSTVQLFTRGNWVRGQVTLDNCGFNFTTERQRVARHQVAIVPAIQRKVWQSNEVVAYKTPHFAAKALRQFRASVTNCPKHVFTPSEIPGVPDVSYDVMKVRSSRFLPVNDNAVATVKYSFKGSSKHYWAVYIYQRRGTVLDATYRVSVKKPTAANVAALRALARITGDRLAAV